MNIALVSRVGALQHAELSRVAAAIDRQVREHLMSVWEVEGTVRAFGSHEDVPDDHVLCTVIPPNPHDGIAGVHKTENGEPFANVEYGSSWSLTASHEILEMIVDPTCDLVMDGIAPVVGGGEVEFLAEICDPVQTRGYLCNNELVSDFVTPEYYATKKKAGRRATFGAPDMGVRTLAPEGSLAWKAASGDWFQMVASKTGKLSVRSVIPEDTTVGLRAAIDRVSEGPRLSLLGEAHSSIKALLRKAASLRKLSGKSVLSRFRELHSLLDPKPVKKKKK